MADDFPLSPGVIIAAPKSGTGKTTVTLGLLRALAQRGLRVCPFKCGPDYIDPAFHEAASGRKSFNVDSWGMRWPLVASLLGDARVGISDFAVAEGLMGLFDGVAKDGEWGNGASADLAVKTGWPVVLVLDVSGQSQTAAAIARGFAGFRGGVDIAGVILNRVGSDRHVRLARSAIESIGLPVFGALPRDANLALPERHLGLVQAEEMATLQQMLEALAGFLERHVDIPRLLQAARSRTLQSVEGVKLPPPGQRIALARDAAFSFVYPHLLLSWRRSGAEIHTFSPLNNEAPRDDADVLWLPGGYPELHAGKIAAASVFKSSVARFAESRPVHGECGGYMVLGSALVDGDGRRHEMLGLLGHETSFANRRLNLGYRRARLLDDCCLGEKGSIMRGHEFHYATISARQDPALLMAEDADGNLVAESGSRRNNTTGSFFHALDYGAPPSPTR